MAFRPHWLKRFLFQHFEEHVGAIRTAKELLTDLGILLNRAMTGLWAEKRDDFSPS